jgi:hypothetical protein
VPASPLRAATRGPRRSLFSQAVVGVTAGVQCHAERTVGGRGACVAAQFAEAAEVNLPVMRPLFMEFPDDASLYTKEDAFLVGSALLVAPVLSKGQRSVAAQLPGLGVWYRLSTGSARSPSLVHTLSPPTPSRNCVWRPSSLVVDASTLCPEHTRLTAHCASDRRGGGFRWAALNYCWPSLRSTKLYCMSASGYSAVARTHTHTHTHTHPPHGVYTLVLVASSPVTRISARRRILASRRASPNSQRCTAAGGAPLSRPARTAGAGEKHASPATVTVDTTDLAQIPVFVRGGFIVPRRERPRRSSTAQAGDPYTLLVALDTTGRAQGHLYEDDGLTTAHQQGAFVFRTFTFAGGKLRCVHHPACPCLPHACVRGLAGSRTKRTVS